VRETPESVGRTYGLSAAEVAVIVRSLALREAEFLDAHRRLAETVAQVGDNARTHQTKGLNGEKIQGGTRADTHGLRGR